MEAGGGVVERRRRQHLGANVRTRPVPSVRVARREWEWRREDGDDRRRWVAVDRRRGWLDFGGVAQPASSDGGGKKGRPNSSNRNPNPSFDPLRSISPIYGSFSLDRGGWSLTLSYY